ncbi:MAG: hypothetical protein BWK72_07530 [Rhodoferax ferrireducens]|uniref:EamA domain-containing protein n=2 Tax=Pseudomonadota TaxID=1224 RepID=A0A1Y1R026_9GAMM|nr:MAG: hypothetical protein BWK72_07530 [Rhodoferax ferrireducens]OQX17348.1 MAG: hypothetical protein BWK73_01300 [Thiothrix lacustris]
MLVVLTTLVATLLIQLGYFMWKVSADGQPQIGSAPALVVAKALVTDWRWMLGFASTSVGWVLFVQATALGDISLVQPLMSAGDLLLVVLAVVFLNERMVRVEWAGVLLTVLGAVALAMEAEGSQVTAFDGMRLAVLLGVTLLLGAALLLANRRSRQPEVLLALVVGLCFGAGSILTKALTVASAGPGQSIMTWAVLLNPLLLAVVLANVAGLALLQAAFQRGRASVVVPLQLAMANAITVLAGVVVFAEHITLLRGFGIVLIVVGTTLLQFKPASVAPLPVGPNG